MQKLMKRECANSVCEQTFEISNRKKKYCSDRCRSQMNHLKRSDKYAKEIKWLSGYKFLRELITRAVENGQEVMPAAYLEFAGADIECFPRTIMDENKKEFYPVNDIRVYREGMYLRLIKEEK